MTYPIIKIPQRIKLVFEQAFSGKEIFERLGATYPVLDLGIKYEFRKEFYSTDSEKAKRISEFLEKYPNAKLIYNNYFNEIYEATIYVSEKRFVDPEIQFEKATIGQHTVYGPPDKFILEKKETIMVWMFFFIPITYKKN